MQVTGAIHISTQKDDVKIAKITLDVTGEQKISVQYRKTKRSKKGKVSSSKHTAYNVITGHHLGAFSLLLATSSERDILH